jgi:hypothetical protein
MALQRLAQYPNLEKSKEFPETGITAILEFLVWHLPIRLPEFLPLFI